MFRRFLRLIIRHNNKCLKHKYVFKLNIINLRAHEFYICLQFLVVLKLLKCCRLIYCLYAVLVPWLNFSFWSIIFYYFYVHTHARTQTNTCTHTQHIYIGTEALIPSNDQPSNNQISFVINKHYILTHKFLSLTTSLDQQCRQFLNLIEVEQRYYELDIN